MNRDALVAVKKQSRESGDGVESMLEAQLPILAALQGIAKIGPVYFLLKAAIFFAEENVIVLGTCALFWLVDRRIAVRALVLVLLSEYINFLLKWTFHQPRPYWMSAEILPLSRQPDFGFPTAYAQDALVYWVVIASTLNLKFQTRRFWLLPAFIVPLVSAATILLGANFFHDTAAGLAVGAALLGLVRILEAPVLRFFEAKPKAGSAAFFGLIVGLFGLVALRGATIGEVRIEGTWRELAMAGTTLPPYLVFSPWSANAVFSICAGLTAVAVARELSLRGWVASFAPVTDRRTFFTRLFIGLSGLVILKMCMAVALSPARDLAVGIVYFIGYFCIGLWALAGAPSVFRWNENRSSSQSALKSTGGIS